MDETAVLITDQLAHRSPRVPNWEAENRVLRELGRQFSQPAAVILQHFTAIAQSLCGAGTAGVSLIETSPTGAEVLRLAAIAGMGAAAAGQIIARDHSPCGTCLDRGKAQLYAYPARYFTELQGPPEVVEGLVIPLFVEQQAIGTIWIVSHDPARQFDGEDLRLMSSLAEFLGAALANAQMRETLAATARREQALQAETELANRVSTILENMTNAFVAFDAEWRYTYVNEHAVRVLGRSRSDLIGQVVWQLFPRSVGSLFEQELRRAVREQVAVVFDYDSELFDTWFEVHAYPTPEGIAVYFQDISDRKRLDMQRQQAEAEQERLLQQLAAERARLEAVLQQMPEGVIMADAATGNLVLSNEQAHQILHYTYEPHLPLEMYEQRVPFQAYRPDGSRYSTADYPLERSLQTGEVITHEELELRYGDRDPVVIDVNAAPVLNAVGEIVSAVTVFRDITKRKQTEAELRESQHFIQRVAETTPGILYVYDLVAQRNVYVNQQVTKLLGYTTEQVQQMGAALLPTLIHPADMAQVPAHIAKFHTAQEHEVLELEYRMQHANGEWHWFSGREVVFSRTPAGQPQCILGIVQDITDRKQAEMNLRDSEERFRAIFNQVAVGMNQVGLDQSFILVNRAYCDMTGYSAAELQQMSWAQITHPDDIAADWHQTQRMLVGEIDHYTLEKRYIHKTGDTVWVTLSASVVRDWQGQPQSLIGVIRDISDRKQAELEREQLLTRERQQLKQLHGLTKAALSINSALSLEEVMDVITHQAAAIIGTHQATISVILNQDKATAIHAVYLSEKYAQWRQHPAPPDSAGMNAYVCQENRPLRLTEAELASYLQTQGAVPTPATHPPLRGWLAAPLVGREGQNMGLIQLSDKVIDDFTSADEAMLMQLAQMAAIALENARLYTAEQAARAIAEASREEAEAANRIKDEFLAVLSHELRSPLNPILGWIKLLRSGKLNAQKTTYALETIDRNAKLQTQLVEDLLDVSRILRGKLSLNMVPVSLPTTIEAAMETVRLAAEAKAIALEFTLVAAAAPGGPTPNSQSATWQVLGDSARLQQVIWNLLSNAVKFTDAGGQVEVELSAIAAQLPPPAALPLGLAPLTTTPTHAQIIVRDTGRGIPPHFLPHVFEYFRQADSTTTRQFGGLGLGLAIVRHLVELHGGTVQAASAGLDQGSTFTVKLPLINRDRPPQPPPDQANPPSVAQVHPLAGIRILLVDDHVDTRDCITFTLEQYQAIVTPVGAATEALQLFEQQQFDLLISDVGMPDLDGYTFLQQVRTFPPEHGGTIPAIALTAYAGDFNQQQALAAGFQSHLAKPAEPDTLIALLIKLLHHGAIAPLSASPDPP